MKTEREREQREEKICIKNGNIKDITSASLQLSCVYVFLVIRGSC